MNLPIRPRRLRSSAAIRSMVSETGLTPRQLVLPLFVHEDGPDFEVPSMPGVFRRNIESLLRECAVLHRLGLHAVALFPCLAPALKDPAGSAAFDEDGLVFRAIRAVKAEFPELLVAADVALDPFTDHGHDGLLTADGRDVANDETVAALCRFATLGAAAGADILAPSDMMDGRIGAIRATLDAAGFERALLLAYSAKFASAYYGPFRDAVGSKTAGDALSKKTYQLDPANAREAVREALLDEAEGADMVMVKPAGPYLDIVRAVRDAVRVPVAAYQVSGEYAQIHASARAGWLDLARTRDESLLAIRRAGADIILTYFAKDFAQAAQEG